MRKTLLALTFAVLAAPALAQTAATQTGTTSGGDVGANAGVDTPAVQTTAHVGTTTHTMHHTGAMKKSPQAMDHKAMNKTETGSKTGATESSTGMDTDKNAAGAAVSGN